MDTIFLKFAERLVSAADLESLVLIFVILLLARLLWKTQTRLDEFVKELGNNSQTLAHLTALVKNLIYGNKDL